MSRCGIIDTSGETGAAEAAVMTNVPAAAARATERAFIRCPPLVESGAEPIGLAADRSMAGVTCPRPGVAWSRCPVFVGPGTRQQNGGRRLPIRHHVEDGWLPSARLLGVVGRAARVRRWR